MENKIRIEMEALPENEGFARVAVAAFITYLNPTVEEITDVKTAVSEAVTNAVIHAYGEKGGKIVIRCDLQGDLLHIEIEDAGKGIENVEQAMVPLYTTRPDLERSGMGFAFMEAFMDSLEVESETGRGTLVIMEKKLGSEAFQKAVVGIAVALGLAVSIGLFFLLPMVIGSFFDPWISSPILINLIEGVIRMVIFLAYMILISRMGEMKRVFSYHGAEHKTIRCYEAGLPLTVENVRVQTRKHPRCGTSFLLVVMILSILVFSVASAVLLKLVPGLSALRGTVWYPLIMIAYKLLLLPLVVSLSYEANRLVGRYDNFLTRLLTAPGMWFQNFTTNEPDDGMIEVGIAALEAVLPEREGADRW